jgi:hypothetical protein
VDRERSTFIEKYFNVEWPDRSIYHIMINTAVGDERAVETILNLVRTFDSTSSAARANSPA